jgi:hypothetical protein
MIGDSYHGHLNRGLVGSTTKFDVKAREKASVD